MRLKNPETGTVVHADGELASKYLAMGYVDADSVEPEVTISAISIEKAVEVQTQIRRRGRPPKNRN